MPRARLIDRPRKFTIHLPESVAIRLDLYLASTALGQVPRGAYQAFFVERIEEFFSKMNITPDLLEEVE